MKKPHMKMLKTILMSYQQKNNEDVENHPHITSTENMEDVDKLEEPIEQHIPSDPIEDIDEGPLNEDVIEGPFHCAMIETTED